MNYNYSSRLMEKSCKRDVTFMYLLEGSPVLDHSTFARFRSVHFAPCSETIMAEMSNFLYEIGEISVSRNLARLLLKLADFVAECEEMYGLKLVYENRVKIKHVKKLRKKLYALKVELEIKKDLREITIDN